MSYLRFNHVFFGLLALSFLSVMLLPARISRHAQANVQVLFAPVAAPVRSVSAWVRNRFTTKSVRDEGSPDKPRVESLVYAENSSLRQQVAMLTSELERLQATEKERDRLKELRAHCTPYTVFGGDAGQGALLHLTATSFADLKTGMPAIVADGVVGKIDRVGIAGASLQLITARSSRTGVRIGRIETTDGRASFRLLSSTNVAEGQGKGVMRIALVKSDEFQHIHIGDMVVLDDPDYPDFLQSFRVGRVVEKATRRESPSFGQVTIASFVELTQLREVMIVNRQKTRPAKTARATVE